MSLLLSASGQFWEKFVKPSDMKNIASQTEPDGITRHYNIPYINDKHKHHLLDVYYPENTKGKNPVIIDVHGGGWMYGDKELNRIYNLNLAKRGFTVFNISYRLVPEVTVNEELQDVMCALKFISEHLGDYPCDEKHIMLTGDSAGGMLAAYAAALASSEKLRNIFDVVNPAIRFSFLVLTSPVAYMNEKKTPIRLYTTAMWGEYRKKATYYYMNYNDIIDEAVLPPTAVVSSSGDTLALAQSKKLVDDLEKHGVPVKFINFDKFMGENLPHVFAILRSDDLAGRICIDNYINMYRDIIEKDK